MQLSCDSCGKLAEVQVYRASGTGRSAVKNLCRSCAGDLERILCGNSGLLLPDLPDALVVPNAPARGENIPASVCPICGNNVKDVTESGVVGCPTCFEVFKEEVDEMVRRFHG